MAKRDKPVPHKTGRPLKKLLGIHEKFEAVKKLQQVHLNNRAAMLKHGLHNEIERVRGVLANTAPHHAAHMVEAIPRLTAELEKLKK